MTDSVASAHVLHLGDCVEVLRDLPDASVDAVVSDPPYELGFMGKGWDASGIAYSVALWRDVLRVLKPGGHLLAFGGTRTYHRLACAIEDAGFEIRDSISWVYGSGFPKSLDVSKAIDKAAGAQRKVVGSVRTNVGMRGGNFATGSATADVPVTAPATDDAARWQGWGTALKPAHEPIVVARKPLAGTVAQTVLAHGTGALNIDGCRVGTDGGTTRATNPKHLGRSDMSDFTRGNFGVADLPAGRWPPNFILTHAEGCEEACVEGCPVREMDAQSGERPGMKQAVLRRGASTGRGIGYGSGSLGGDYEVGYGDTGGASRFFPTFRYQAKASRRERNAGLEGMPERAVGDQVSAVSNRRCRKCGLVEFAQPHCECAEPEWEETTTGKQGNFHPTVKPVELMRWLVRLVTPPGGVVLDPFTGSGTTGVAAVLEGFDFIGIEREPEYAEIAERRISWWAQSVEPTLFQEGE